MPREFDFVWSQQNRRPGKQLQHLFPATAVVFRPSRVSNLAEIMSHERF